MGNDLDCICFDITCAEFKSVYEHAKSNEQNLYSVQKKSTTSSK